MSAAMKDDLYQRAILDLARRATGHGRLAEPQVSVRVDNPLCGDRVTLDLEMEDGVVKALAHEVRGCILCQAAASVIGSHAPGQAPSALRATTARLRDLIVTGPHEAEQPAWPELTAFEPVHGYKSRHECVLLPFTALTRALDRAGAA